MNIAEPKINFTELIIPGPIVRPHPARLILERDNEHPRILLQCKSCGESWECPTHGPHSRKAGEPAVEIYGKQIEACPGCGAYSRLVLSTGVNHV